MWYPSSTPHTSWINLEAQCCDICLPNSIGISTSGNERLRKLQWRLQYELTFAAPMIWLGQTENKTPECRSTQIYRHKMGYLPVTDWIQQVTKITNTKLKSCRHMFSNRLINTRVQHSFTHSHAFSAHFYSDFNCRHHYRTVRLQTLNPHCSLQ
jgi:hypothetical protein